MLGRVQSWNELLENCNVSEQASELLSVAYATGSLRVGTAGRIEREQAVACSSSIIGDNHVLSGRNPIAPDENQLVIQSRSLVKSPPRESEGHSSRRMRVNLLAACGRTRSAARNEINVARHVNCRTFTSFIQPCSISQ